jgi:phosphoglycolate phosphatase-like HAD superfamily hydrolase
MLGLPDAVHGRLFDLDGVLTLTASGHAAAWKRMLVVAGRAGEFTFGVDGVGEAQRLLEHGGDVVVEHLAELLDGR